MTRSNRRTRHRGRSDAVGSIPVAHPTPPRRLRFSRRFVLAVLVFVGGLLAATVAVAFSWPSSPPPTIVHAGSPDDYVTGQPVHFEDSHFWLVRLEKSRFVALVDRDTHEVFSTSDCPIQWREDLQFQERHGVFRGKCSGSNFDVAGNILSGPSPRRMDQYSVAVENDSILVDTTKARCRDENFRWNQAPLAGQECVTPE